MGASLFLNGMKADLSNRPVTRKIQIGDVSEISDRKSSFSYTIKLPKTSNNMRILEMLGVIGNTSRKPFEKVAADYVVESIFLVRNGSVVIRDAKDSYQLNMINGAKNIVEVLGDKKLIDLPLEDLSHILTEQLYVDSFENTEGYIYGIADFGLGASLTIKPENQAPSIFTHTIFRRIFESNGLSLQGEFFTTNENYLSEVITPSRGYEVEDVALTNTPKGAIGSNTPSHFQFSNEFISYNEKFTLTDNSLIDAIISSGELRFTAAGTYRLDLVILYTLYLTSGTITCKLNNNIISSTYLPQGNSLTKNQSLTFTVEVGDQISIFIEGSSNVDSGDPVHPFLIDYSASITSNLTLLTGGHLVKAVDYIGDMKQYDFLRDVINRYGLVMHPVQGTGEFKFKRLEAILMDRDTVEDWTSRLSGSMFEKYKSGYAKINRGLYEYPDSIVIPNNDGEMLINNENTTEEKTMISSKFEIALSVGNIIPGDTVSGEIFSIPIRGLKDAEVVQLQTPLKVMRIIKKDESITVKLFDEAIGTSVETGVPFLSLDFIGMDFVLGNFYKAFQSLIDNFKMVSAGMNLSVIDIFNLDFFRLKFLKQTGRFYYLNSVKDTTGKIAKVDMVEIREFPQNQPPTQVGTFEFNIIHSSTRTITELNLLSGYEDPEVDDALKVKIISGFNSNVLLKQGGVTITSQTEILFADLDLTAVETVGDVNPYTESWVIAIADVGSGIYGSVTGLIIANVLAFTNFDPIAEAGGNQSLTVPAPAPSPSAVVVTLNGSGSSDNTGEIVSYSWAIISKPGGSNAAISQNTATPIAYVNTDTGLSNGGDYTCELTVTDEFGATDTDQMSFTISHTFKP